VERRSLGKAGTVLFVIYVLEVGTFLLMAPWSRFWEKKVASQAPATVQPLLYSAYFRGFISGIGLLHLFAAVRQVDAWRKEREA